MDTFLSQTARHYAALSPRLSQTVFVVPSRRARRYLTNDIKRLLPACDNTPKVRVDAINDFFQKIYGVKTTDRLHLVLTLYGCYRDLNPKAESLDDFLQWGQVMISDFDNVDKWMVDAGKLFVNVNDFKSIQDTYSYLTPEQRDAIEHFVRHFRDRNGRLTVSLDTPGDDIKKRFLSVWNLLGPLYKDFNEKLTEKGMAYEGKIYRAFADSIKNGADIKTELGKAYPYATRFVFVGLNALSESEKTVLRAVRDAGMAEFVWDFSSKEIKNGRNKAGFFIRKNIEEFPQSFPLDTKEALVRPTVHVVSVASSTGQTKLVPGILERCGSPMDSSAVVLPDERLLMPLLSALPESVGKVNVTMGYPLTESAVYSLMRSVGFLQITARSVDGTNYFHHKAVESIITSGIFSKAITTHTGREAVARFYNEAKQYVPETELRGDTVLDTVFRLATSLDAAIDENKMAEMNRSLCAYLKEVAGIIGSESNLKNVDPVEAEFLSRYREMLDIVNVYDLPVRPSTWLRLLDGFLRSESLPFDGGDMQGLQVMGTLETRAMDFENIIILSANEEMFPRRSVDSSFIPPELRKGFGMPTSEFQDAMWSYYFYRFIQRAKNVWMVYDSRTDGLNSGEESRFIKQLEYHFRFRLHRMSASATIGAPEEELEIEKTQADIEKIRSGHLSASALQNYLACQVKFYYQTVKGLKTREDLSEGVDAAMLGTIFHEVMHDLYDGKKTVTLDELKTALSDENMLRERIRAKIIEKMRVLDVEGRNLVIEQVILEYVKGVLRHDISLLVKSGRTGFRIIGLERLVMDTIEGFPFIGFIDRIDSYLDGEVRVVDYKTGMVEDEDVYISDSNAGSIAEKIFGESNTGRPKIALQMYLYDRLAKKKILHPGEAVVNSVYSAGKLLTSPLPEVPENGAFNEAVEVKLKETLSEIADTSIPFKRTTDTHVCAMCDFRAICGR